MNFRSIDWVWVLDSECEELPPVKREPDGDNRGSKLELVSTFSEDGKSQNKNKNTKNTDFQKRKYSWCHIIS